MPNNPLIELRRLGQSVWLDYIRRAMLEDGTLVRLIREDGLAGVTSNPAIFHKAITEHQDYDGAIEALARKGAAPAQIYESLAIADIQTAADRFLDLFQRSEGRDGFVSLEVSPRLAHDTEATVAEARRLWARVERPNLMIKVPGTRAGLPAIRRLVAEGLNINVTLLFSVDRYAQILEAFMAGLEDRIRTGQAVQHVVSVASFFLSRIDTLVDQLLDAHRSENARALRGRAAIACARLSYEHYRAQLASAQWRRLAVEGARMQRLLWASTSVKDPAYGATKYVDALVAPDTVSTMPPDTLSAYRLHGVPAVRIDNDLAGARALATQLAALDIDLDAVAEQLEQEGVRKFEEPFEQLLLELGRRRHESHG